MSKAELQAWLVANRGFRAHYVPLLLESVRAQFTGVHCNASQPDTVINWSYLLQCASLLAQSDKEACQSVALRIAQYCLCCDSTSEIERDGATIILDMLGNRPAINLAQSRHLLINGIEDRLPLHFLREWDRRAYDYTLDLRGHAPVRMNHFQHKFWNAANNSTWISISAPTSAGKSFIFTTWISDFVRAHPQSTIIYVVPTRALIQQVEEDLKTSMMACNLSNVAVSTLPLHASFQDGKANVFVLTQERLHILLAAFQYRLKVDLLVIDEAHKIGDSYRGVLLQQAIEAVAHAHIDVRVMFASPQSDNPEMLLEDAPSQSITSSLLSEDTSVNQNLIWATSDRRDSKKWHLELIADAEIHSIGEFRLPNTPSPDSKRLPFVAHALASEDGGNLIYVNRAADAEKAAKQIYDLLDSNDSLESCAPIQSLRELVAKVIHPEYSLVHVLRRGVAFHYGNMPLLVKSEIERLFGMNLIKYLVCTSTLIEGVNLPCKSIFVRGPKKGIGKPMGPTDFWNLAGRAGRWGKEFQGNIICVDARRTDVWGEAGAPKEKYRYRIGRTSDRVMENANVLLEFIHSQTPREVAASNPELEYVFSFIVSSFLRAGSLAETAWVKRLDPTYVRELDALVASVIHSVDLPAALILRNPGISPFAMRNMLNYFASHTGDIDELIPVSADSESAVDEYVKILQRINTYLFPAFGAGGMVFRVALLVVDWMKGYPLARLITSRKSYLERKEIEHRLANVIRDVMDDVEQYARFRVPKYLACYCDLLKEHLTANGRSSNAIDMENLNVWLEFGVSQQTQLSMIGLGLSRSTAIALSELISNEKMSSEECIEWLQSRSWIVAEMPALMKKEIDQVLLRCLN